jgi:hypothetical protein
VKSRERGVENRRFPFRLPATGAEPGPLSVALRDG